MGKRNPADKAFYARGRGMHRMLEDQQGYLLPPVRPRKPRKAGKPTPASGAAPREEPEDRPPIQG